MLALFDFTIVMPTLVYRLLLALGVALSVGTMSWPLFDKFDKAAETRAAHAAEQASGDGDKTA